MTSESMPAPQRPAAYLKQRYRLIQAMSEFTVPLLVRLYHHFDGDVVSAIVLGEIGNRNAGAWLASAENDPQAMEDERRHREVLRPCNALSIADSTGLPRETVRRKVATLIERGLVYRGDRGHLFLHGDIAAGFDPISFSSVQALREAAARIDALWVDE